MKIFRPPLRPACPLPDRLLYPALRYRTVLHAGANEIIVRDRTPAPFPGSRQDPLCDNDEYEKDVDPFMRRICPHELWLALDLDGDTIGHGEGKGGSNAAWKGHYDRFTLRVSWPASVSSPKRQTLSPTSRTNDAFPCRYIYWIYAVKVHPKLTLETCVFFFFEKHPVQVALSLHSPTPPPYPSSMSSVPSVRMARLHFARIRLAQEGIRVPHTVEERGNSQAHTEHKGEEDREGTVPLVVILEPLVLGMLPASVLPVVSTLLLGVLGLLGLLGATGTTGIWRELGEVVERARKELAVVEESKEKEKKGK